MSYKIKIVMGPKSYLNEFLNKPYITLEDYVIKIDSLTRNLVEKFTDNDYEEILKDKIILAKTESYSGITSAALSNFIQIVNKSIEFGTELFYRILQNLLLIRLKVILMKINMLFVNISIQN